MYTTMLPRLEAQEAMDGITEALASQNRMLEDNSRAQYVNRLERDAAGVRRVKRATSESFADMGVEVVIEKQKGGE
jgi:hypothetical protein